MLCVSDFVIQNVGERLYPIQFLQDTHMCLYLHLPDKRGAAALQ